jgi:hypothetical protein
MIIVRFIMGSMSMTVVQRHRLMAVVGPPPRSMVVVLHPGGFMMGMIHHVMSMIVIVGST